MDLVCDVCDVCVNMCVILQEWDQPDGGPAVFDLFDEDGFGVLSGESLKHFACAVFGVAAHKVCVCVCVCV
jgi:hypothetical protein